MKGKLLKVGVSKNNNHPPTIAKIPPKRVKNNITVEKINQKLYHVGKSEKINLLLGLLQRDNIQNGIIFVNTKSEAYEIASRLTYCGIKSEYLIGDLPQVKRSKIIEDFKLKNKLEGKGITVFLNLELRLTYTNKEDNSCDIHIIFHPELEESKIKAFLTNISIDIDGTSKKAIAMSSVDDFKKGVVEDRDTYGYPCPLVIQ